jgi:hypothetical protein
VDELLLPCWSHSIVFFQPIEKKDFSFILEREVEKDLRFEIQRTLPRLRRRRRHVSAARLVECKSAARCKPCLP